MRNLALVAGLLFLGCEPDPVVRSYAVPRDTPATPTPAAPSTPSAPTPGQPAMQASPEMVAAAAREGSPSFPAPPGGWTAKDPGAMRKGSWSVGPAEEPADLAVTVFPGDVGGRVANFNRWRQQLGLPAASADAFAAIRPAKVGALEGELVHFTSADGAMATRAVLVAHKGSTWFFKLTGPSATVKAAAGDFDAFVAATQLP